MVWRLLATVSSASCLAFAVGAAPAAAAPKSGTVGDPQPELAQFKVGGAVSNGSGAVLPDGTLVLAAPTSSGSSIKVCVLHTGGRSCVATAKLSPEPGDSFSTSDGVTEVLVTGENDVSVVAYDCCNSSPDGVFVFNSTNDGNSFGPAIKAGNLDSVGAGTVAGGDLVVATTSSGSLHVQAFPPNPSSTETSQATPNGKVDGDTSLTTYNGGVLVASDDLTNTYVEYAKSGSNFNASSSYSSVGTFSKQTVTAVSGNALLTDPGGSLTGGERLRFFNGTSFGKSYKVPDSRQGDDGYFAMQEFGTVVHVFFEGRRDSYDLFSETTTNGRQWSKLQRYGSAIKSTWPAPVLGPTGAGLVYESSSGSPSLAQPILNTFSVHITLKRSRVHRGHGTTLSGKVSHPLYHQLVTLERKSGTKWYTVKTTQESASGRFSFSVPGTTRTYRAVVAYEPGYFQYGYSNSVKLTAT